MLRSKSEDKESEDINSCLNKLGGSISESVMKENPTSTHSKVYKEVM